MSKSAELPEGMSIDKFKLATQVGFLIVVAHIVVFISLAMSAVPEEGKESIRIMAAIPTTTYSLAFVKWMIDNQKHYVGEQVNKNFGRLVWLIVVPPLLFLVLAPWFYRGLGFSVDGLKSAYLLIESGFGGAFALIFSDLFEKSESPDKKT